MHLSIFELYASACVQFDIDPMKLPSGVDEELELLDQIASPEMDARLRSEQQKGAGGRGGGAS